MIRGTLAGPKWWMQVRPYGKIKLTEQAPLSIMAFIYYSKK